MTGKKLEPIRENYPRPLRGTILHIQRLSTEDGPGIRTSVFLKGCPLHCVWCHNPESISFHPQVQWQGTRCIGCGRCVLSCPNEALHRNGVLQRDASRCRVCATCVEICPANAQELLGNKVTVEETARELLKDKSFFNESGGGVTLTGGEPTLQPEFSSRLLQSMRENGIATALDTCGLCSQETLRELADLTDVILYDVKLIDTDAHKRLTGMANERILDNLRWLSRYLDIHPDKRLWVRTPVIPGATDSEENIRGISTWITQHIPWRVERWELVAFNNLCKEKYERIGKTWEFGAVSLLSSREKQMIEGWAKDRFFDPERVLITGPEKVGT